MKAEKNIPIEINNIEYTITTAVDNNVIKVFISEKSSRIPIQVATFYAASFVAKIHETFNTVVDIVKANPESFINLYFIILDI